jgi:hypothetical protein
MHRRRIHEGAEGSNGWSHLAPSAPLGSVTVAVGTGSHGGAPTTQTLTYVLAAHC